ncbi:GyrI-like domain-containing protein [Sporosarcina sp. ACRSL]|uniref:GyrI-like domain-containing protein n=1 Tax=Sporosarcina sp. ACRSL TaxID=2918215 RepID=UPI001EF6456D|nr:GyrI-like domain-containing protein [Sporosarcina sp. ACRSL]MCG7343496.1 GyrI-like domain-containing protein [Sporosarcina sp. ACRSL]
MEPIQLREMEKIRVIGFTVTDSLRNIIEKGFVRDMHNTIKDRMSELESRTGNGVYLIQIYPTDEAFTPDLPYENIVGVGVSNDQHIPEGMMEYTIPAGRYAHFLHQGPESNIHQTYDGITEWLRNQYCDPSREIDIEYWDDRYKGESEDSEIDLYVPLRK